MVKIYNEDCFLTMTEHLSEKSVDIILTSPPYNTGRFSTSEKERKNRNVRYDAYIDNMTQQEYMDWTVSLFAKFDRVLRADGVILYNLSYGSDNTINTESVGLMWLVVAKIILDTPFAVADRIIWKKSAALPNNASKNKLTRIVEDIFVIVRKSEMTTFDMNKKVVSSKGGRYGKQPFYENVFNFIEARNNDGSCDLNKATYSSDLCEKLLNMYALPGAVIYDPFMGTGTTGVACNRLGFDCFGSELSEAQVQYANARVGNSKPIGFDTQIGFFD